MVEAVVEVVEEGVAVVALSVEGEEGAVGEEALLVEVVVEEAVEVPVKTHARVYIYFQLRQCEIHLGLVFRQFGLMQCGEVCQDSAEDSYTEQLVVCRFYNHNLVGFESLKETFIFLNLLEFI